MKETETVTVRVQRAYRLQSSRSGNPAYMLVVGPGDQWRTAPNASCAYDVPNIFGVHLDRPALVALTLGRRGFVVRIEPAQRVDSTGTASAGSTFGGAA